MLSITRGGPEGAESTCGGVVDHATYTHATHARTHTHSQAGMGGRTQTVQGGVWLAFSSAADWEGRLLCEEGVSGLMGGGGTNTQTQTDICTYRSGRREEDLHSHNHV